MKEVNANQIEDIAKLVKKAKKGSKKAFQLLYQSTWKSIYYMLLKKTGNESDAKVLLNEVFTNVFEGIETLENDMAFYSWVSTIANYRYLDFLRKNGKKEVEELYADNEHVNTQEEHDEDFIPDLALEKKENRALVMKAIDELPEKQREAVYMFYYLNMKIKEIARSTNTSENTVLKRLHDARKNLKTKLGEFIEKGVIIYNMAGFFILRQLFREDILHCVDDKIGATIWAEISRSISYKLAVKSASAKAFRTYAVKFTAGAAVAGVTAAAVLQTTQIRELLMPSPTVLEQQADNQANNLHEFELAEEISPTIEIISEEIPLASTAFPEVETVDLPSVSNEPDSSSAIPLETQPTPLQVQETQAQPITEEIPPLNEKTPVPQNIIMELELVYEIGEAPDETGLIKDIASYSGGAFDFYEDEVMILSSNFDSGNIGTYNIWVTCETTKGNSVEIRAAVNVYDTISPKIIIENTNISLQAGTILSPEEIVDLAGLAIFDNSGENVTLTLLGYEKIDFFTTTKQEYALTVRAEDSAGNAALQKNIFVTIE